MVNIVQFHLFSENRKVIQESHFLREHTLSFYDSLEGYRILLWMPTCLVSIALTKNETKTKLTVICAREFKDPIFKAEEIPYSLFLFKMPTICTDSALVVSTSTTLSSYLSLSHISFNHTIFRPAGKKLET